MHALLRRQWLQRGPDAFRLRYARGEECNGLSVREMFRCAVTEVCNDPACPSTRDTWHAIAMSRRRGECSFCAPPHGRMASLRVASCHLLLLLLPVSSALSEVERLRQELARARAALMEARGLLPSASAWDAGVASIAQDCTAHGGYSGVYFVGTSSARVKRINVRLWSPSATPPVISNLTLQQPLDKFNLSVASVAHDSFVLEVRRTDRNGGWGQNLWGEYTASGVFDAAALRLPGSQPSAQQPASSWPASLSEARSAQARLTAVVEGYWEADAQPVDEADANLAPQISDARNASATSFYQLPSNMPPIAPTSLHVLPLLRHLGANFADVETLWQALVQAHPHPSSATVIEVGVAGGEQAMFAADAGMNVIAIEPQRAAIEAPLLTSKARARPNLKLVRAAATSRDGHVRFSTGASSSHSGSHIVLDGSGGKAAGGRRLTQQQAALPEGPIDSPPVRARADMEPSTGALPVSPAASTVGAADAPGIASAASIGGGRGGRGIRGGRRGRLRAGRSGAGRSGGGRRGGGRAAGGRGAGGRGAARRGAVGRGTALSRPKEERVRSVRIDTLLRQLNVTGRVYMVKIDVQGFELDVLLGLLDSLIKQRVLYVLLEFWPAGMQRDAKVSAKDVLHLLARCGYALFDTHTLKMDGGTEPLGSNATFKRPTELDRNAEWYQTMDRKHGSRFGYWTDIVAVASHSEPELYT